MTTAPIMDIAQAEKLTSRLQNVHPGNRTPCRIDGETVMVGPLPGNAFRIISLPVPEPTELKSYETLKNICGEIHVEREADYRFYYVTTATWDTMVHYLVRTGILDIRK